MRKCPGVRGAVASGAVLFMGAMCLLFRVATASAIIVDRLGDSHLWP